jgi:peptide/nickel transport system permease protein
MAHLKKIIPYFSAVIPVLILIFVALWVVVPGLFVHGDPLVGVGTNRLLAPSLEHPFGTDQFGRDVLTRIIYGAQLSISSVIIAVTLAIVSGSILGLLAGFVGGLLDDIIMRIVDVMMAIPNILLSLAVITALGGGAIEIAIAVGIPSIASIARTMRSEVLKVRTADYVTAAHASGVRWYKTLIKHILPNSWGPVIVLAALEFGNALLSIAALSFLGYGAKPPIPEWGSMISEGRDFLATAWWLTTVPGLVIVVIVLSINHLARFNRHARNT